MTVMLFVHGVANRDGARFQEMIKRRDQRFAAALGENPTILNPYWGGSAADPAWDLECIPKMDSKYKSLGFGEPKAIAPAMDSVLVAARVDFPGVVAALSAADIADKEAQGDDAALAEAEKFWAAAAHYVELDSKPDWLAAVQDDAGFLKELQRQSEPAITDVHLGFFDKLKGVAGKVAGALSNAANEPFARIAREKLSPAIAIFIGDVFCYLKERDLRAVIRSIVLTDLEAAALKAHEGGEKLILAGHSFGGVILYDLLTDEQAMKALETALGFPLKVDLFLTVGSQVALFEELKVYTASDRSVPGAGEPKKKINLPARADRWWNAFDRMDVLSFVTEPVFEGATDFSVDTVASVLGAHTAYFYNMVFYERLGIRLKEAGLK